MPFDAPVSTWNCGAGAQAAMVKEVTLDPSAKLLEGADNAKPHKC